MKEGAFGILFFCEHDKSFWSFRNNKHNCPLKKLILESSIFFSANRESFDRVVIANLNKHR